MCACASKSCFRHQTDYYCGSLMVNRIGSILDCCITDAINSIITIVFRIFTRSCGISGQFRPEASHYSCGYCCDSKHVGAIVELNTSNSIHFFWRAVIFENLLISGTATINIVNLEQFELFQSQKSQPASVFLFLLLIYSLHNIQAFVEIHYRGKFFSIIPSTDKMFFNFLNSLL